MENRITVILHPNPTRVDIVLNTKRFNNEQYRFQRDKKPSGHEERMLKRLNNVIGLRKAETSKSTLSLETEECFHPNEYLPKVIEIVKEFAGPDYNGVVYLDNRQTNGDGKYDREGWCIKEPTKKEITDIGVEFKVWSE